MKQEIATMIDEFIAQVENNLTDKELANKFNLSVNQAYNLRLTLGYKRRHSKDITKWFNGIDSGTSKYPRISGFSLTAIMDKLRIVKDRKYQIRVTNIEPKKLTIEFRERI